MTEVQKTALQGKSLLLYDGLCGLCNRVVLFLLKRDHSGRLLYAPMRSRLGREMLAKYGQTPEKLESVALILHANTPEEKFLHHSTAVAHALLLLGGLWAFTGRMLLVFPNFLRDAGYGFISRIRYRIFGKYDQCPLPTAEQRARFLALDEC